MLLNTANNNADALALLWNHLPDELFNRVKSERPNANDIDAFFESVRNCYLERKPTTFTYSNNNTITTLSNIIANPSNTQQNKDLDDALDLIHTIALEYGYSPHAPKDFKAMKLQIDYEAGKHGYNMIKQPRIEYNMKRKPTKPKKSVRHCSNCGSTKHTKRNCNSKRKSKKFNLGNRPESESESSENCSSDSEEESQTSEESSSEEDEVRQFNAGKKKSR